MSLDQEGLLGFLESELGVDGSTITPTTGLFSTGILDSFSLVSLLNFLEEAGELKVEPADVNLENMDSIARILAFAQSKAGSVVG